MNDGANTAFTAWLAGRYTMSGIRFGIWVFAQNRQAQELLDSYHRERTDLRILPAREFAQKLGNEKLIILDVRPDEEYQISHIRGAISMQADRIHDYLETVPDGAEIVAYCRGPMCMMADTVVQQLNQRGHQAWRLDIGVAECAYYGIAVDHDPEQGLSGKSGLFGIERPAVRNACSSHKRCCRCSPNRIIFATKQNNRSTQ